MIYLIDGMSKPITFYVLTEKYIETNKFNYDEFYKKKLNSFFENAFLMNIVMSHDKCIICNDDIPEQGATSTDGFWEWSTCLFHYVSHHNIRIPKPFEEYLIEKDFKIGKYSKESLVQFREETKQYEIDWELYEDEFECFLKNNDISYKELLNSGDDEKYLKLENEFIRSTKKKVFLSYDLTKVNYIEYS